MLCSSTKLITYCLFSKYLCSFLWYKPIFSPIRGGTDGATITYMGLPCPNIGVGDYNCHGRYEYVSINEMEMVYNVVKNLLENKELYK